MSELALLVAVVVGVELLAVVIHAAVDPDFYRDLFDRLRGPP
ncbi:MAG: hypothetical protein ABEJ05_08935 [Haloglomus sp.]